MKDESMPNVMDQLKVALANRYVIERAAQDQLPHLPVQTEEGL